MTDTCLVVSARTRAVAIAFPQPIVQVITRTHGTRAYVVAPPGQDMSFMEKKYI